MDEIRAFTTRIVESIAAATPPALASPTDEVLGICPVCQTIVTEGFMAFQCASGKRCSFVIFKRIAGRKISPALVRVLLARGRSQALKGFRSKKGKRFSATLVLDQEGKPIPPFTLNNCMRIATDSTLAEVKWQGSSDLASLAGKPVRFRFHLARGRLFAFWVSPKATGASHGYVAAGGPGFTGPTDTVGMAALEQVRKTIHNP